MKAEAEEYSASEERAEDHVLTDLSTQKDPEDADGDERDGERSSSKDNDGSPSCKTYGPPSM